MGDLGWRYRESLRSGWLLFLAEEPVRVQLTTSAPRIVLQAVFYCLIGRLVGGAAGLDYALVGSAAFAASSRTVIAVCDVPMTDSWSDSYYRLQGGVLGPTAVYACRAVPYAVSGFAASLLVLLVTGPVVGAAGRSVALVPAVPLLLLTAVTSTAFGLAVAALALGRSADVLFGNVAAYLVLAVTGVVVPAGSWLGYLGDVLPLDHGLAAVRALLGGRPWVGQAGLEAAVGCGWLLVSALVLAHRDRRVRGASGSVLRLSRSAG